MKIKVQAVLVSQNGCDLGIASLNIIDDDGAFSISLIQAMPAYKGKVVFRVAVRIWPFMLKADGITEHHFSRHPSDQMDPVELAKAFYRWRFLGRGARYGRLSVDAWRT